MTVELHAARKFRSTMSHLVYTQLVQAASQEHITSLFIPADKLVEYGYKGSVYPSSVRARFVTQILNDFEFGSVRSFKITDVDVSKEGVTFHVGSYEKDLHEQKTSFLKTEDRKMLEDVAFEQQPSATLLSKSIHFTKKSAFEIVDAWKRYVSNSDAMQHIKKIGIASVFSGFVRNIDALKTVKAATKRLVLLLESVACGELFAVKHFLNPAKNDEMEKFKAMLGSSVNADEYVSTFETIISSQPHMVLNRIATSIVMAYDSKDQNTARSVWDFIRSIKSPAVIV